MEKHFDTIILGGGLAGLTLSLQLKQQNPDIRVLVLERRDGAAPDAAHKVGESTVELATHYLRDLKGYLDEHQLPKHGLRFFFPAKGKQEIQHRVELGPKVLLPVPSHQLDRGILENDLITFSREAGNEVREGAKVESMETGDPSHSVTWSENGEKHTATARWVVDASGRAGLLKRKLEPVSLDVGPVVRGRPARSVAGSGLLRPSTTWASATGTVDASGAPIRACCGPA